MSEPTSDQLNILVIDDDETMRHLLSEILRREQHQAITVASAEEGLELLPVWTFQIAFIDHSLPGMEGLVLGEYLRRSNPDMTLALVTGADDRSLARRSQDLSIAYIQKPFRRADILHIVDSYREAALEREAQRKSQSDQDFAPPISRFVDELTSCFAMPNMPSRIEERLVETVKRSLNGLRTAGRYNERDRVLALCGLLTARALGVALPKAGNGNTLYEEYDQLMGQNGRRVEFTQSARTS